MIIAVQLKRTGGGSRWTLISPLLGIIIAIHLKQTGGGLRQTLSIPTAEYNNRCPAKADGRRIKVDS